MCRVLIPSPFFATSQSYTFLVLCFFFLVLQRVDSFFFSRQCHFQFGEKRFLEKKTPENENVV